MAMDKAFKVLIGLAVGWVVSEAATDVLESLGVPKQAATAAGGIIGALV